MLKKLILWSLYASFLGLLLGGAAYRTSIKLADGGNTQSHGNSTSNGAPVESASGQSDEQRGEHDQVVLDGYVMDINNDSLSIIATDGKVFEISRRAWRYAQELGFYPQAGDSLRLEGFYENGDFEVVRMIDLNQAQSVSLRDESGHPLWSGNH